MSILMFLEREGKTNQIKEWKMITLVLKMSTYYNGPNY